MYFNRLFVYLTAIQRCRTKISGELTNQSLLHNNKKLAADRAAFMANNPYGYNMQMQTLQTRMLAESEAGSNRAPPMLLSIEDFPSWIGRFETHINGQDTSLW